MQEIFIVNNRELPFFIIDCDMALLFSEIEGDTWYYNNRLNYCLINTKFLA